MANYKKEGNQQVEFEEAWVQTFYTDLKQKHGDFDYVIIGHRHFPISVALDGGSTYFNLGEWVNYTSYAVFDGEKVSLLNFDETKTKA